MAEPARPDPLAAAHRVKDLARDLAQEVADGYRKSSRPLRLKAAVVATWALLSLLTLWLVCPGSSGSANALGAVVALADEAAGGRSVSVRNDSDEIWTDVVVTIEGGWVWKTSTLRNGERAIRVGIPQFQKDGAAAPASLQPRTVTVSCREGEVTLPLGREGGR